MGSVCMGNILCTGMSDPGGLTGRREWLTSDLCPPFRQLREEFDRGVDVQLDEEHSIHDVAALLKEFLRDMPDPLLTRELYTAFINTTCTVSFLFYFIFYYFSATNCITFFLHQHWSQTNSMPSPSSWSTCYRRAIVTPSTASCSSCQQ